MSDPKKTSSSSAGVTKKKDRPPPLEVDMSNPMHPAGALSIPTMRGVGGMYMGQQIIVTPAAQSWDVQEQTQLERLQRVMCFPNESLLNKSIKISAFLANKTVRDVACRLKLMEETASRMYRHLDELDRILNRNDGIITELQNFPSTQRTSEQNSKIFEFMNDFISSSKIAKNSLDIKGLKLPVHILSIPESPQRTKQQEVSQQQQQAQLQQPFPQHPQVSYSSNSVNTTGQSRPPS